MADSVKIKKSYDHLLKLLLMGDYSAGTSAILWRYHDLHTPNPHPLRLTIGVDFKCVTLTLDGVIVILQIWDIDWREKYYPISTSTIYYRGTRGAMVVYSVCDEMSFKNCTKWMERIQLGAGPNVCGILVGHKYCKDEEYTEKKRVVSRERAEMFAHSHGMEFMEVSAETTEGIDEAFLALARMALQSVSLTHEDPLTYKKSLAERFKIENANANLASLISKKKNDITALYNRERAADRRGRDYQKKAKKLDQQCQKQYPSVQSAVERIAEAAENAHTAEQVLATQQDLMVDVGLRVREIERRVGELQEQLRRAQGGARRGTRKQSFWVVGRGEIEEMEEELGRGGWATVCVANFRGLRVAAKCMHRDLIVCDYNRALFSREMSIAAIMRHPNLVQFIGATLEGSPIILTELMATSLRAELEKQPLSPDQISSVSLDVVRALLYLHLMQPDPIIHRDVSSANVLLNPGPEASWLAKLSDYGSANYVRQVTTRAPGNPSYAAPEADTPTQQSTKMDVFSYGVLLLEMWHRQTPEQGRHGALLQGLERGEVREMVGRCLQHNPARRLTMADLLLELQ